MRNSLRRVYSWLTNTSLRRGAHSRGSWLITLLTLFELRHEARAVANGRVRTFHRTPASQITTLRRDIHRIEKGLIMQPRRLPFGRDYVLGAVQALEALNEGQYLDSADVRWAQSVLRAYADVVSTVDESWVREVARRVANLPVTEPGETRAVPAERGSLASSGVGPDDFSALAQQRRSVRWFEQRTVDKGVLDACVKVAAEAPSACNRQNVRIVFVHGQPEAGRVLACAGGTRGFAEQVPVAAVLVGRLGGYKHTFDRHAVYVDGGLLAMLFQLALETHGLSSCCVNWPDVSRRDRAIAKLVGIEDDERVIMLLAIGYAEATGGVPASVKRGLATLRTHDDRSEG